MQNDLSAARIPRRRTMTRDDGSIDFRTCLKTARRRLAGLNCNKRRKGIADLQLATLDIRFDAEQERQAWEAMPPILRAAATAFDALVGPRCACAISRRDAILAISADRPAVWDTLPAGPQNPYVGLINSGLGRAKYEQQLAIVLCALTSDPTLSSIDTLIPLNSIGAEALRVVRSARRRIAAATRKVG